MVEVTQFKMPIDKLGCTQGRHKSLTGDPWLDGGRLLVIRKSIKAACWNDTSFYLSHIWCG